VVLHIFQRVIEGRLRERSGCPGGRLGTVSFVQRFGSALNAHVHFHHCVIDGVCAIGEDGRVLSWHEAVSFWGGQARAGAISVWSLPPPEPGSILVRRKSS
jgi:hypothetical protein